MMIFTGINSGSAPLQENQGALTHRSHQKISNWKSLLQLHCLCGESLEKKGIDFCPPKKIIPVTRRNGLYRSAALNLRYTGYAKIANATAKKIKYCCCIFYSAWKYLAENVFFAKFCQHFRFAAAHTYAVGFRQIVFTCRMQTAVH